MNQNEMQAIIASAFERVGRLRKLLGLPTVEDVPVLEEEPYAGGYGGYQRLSHSIGLSAAFTFDAFGWSTIYHECCHAHQRAALMDEEEYGAMLALDYMDRWAEIEARKVAYLCMVQMAGVKLYRGDYDRIEEVDDHRYVRMTRSLRLRINDNPTARATRYFG